MNHFTEEMPGHWYGDATYRRYEIRLRKGRYIIYCNGMYADWADSLEKAIDWCYWEHNVLARTPAHLR